METRICLIMEECVRIGALRVLGSSWCVKGKRPATQLLELGSERYDASVWTAWIMSLAMSLRDA